MRVFLELQFDGTDFCGWQRQPQGPSVQSVLEDVLSRWAGVRVGVVGCGRTDSGVHASYFVAHTDLPESCAERGWEDGLRRINGMLPPTIAVAAVVPVSGQAHARFSARERTYVYRLHEAKDVFLQGKSVRVYRPLDVQRMQAAAEFLLGTRDFACFCKSGTDPHATTWCDLHRVDVTRVGPHRVEVVLTANRFLRNMVRAIVGTLLEVNSGRRQPEDMPALLASCDRTLAGKSAPACGLYLADVVYPEEVWPADWDRFARRAWVERD